MLNCIFFHLTSLDSFLMNGKQVEVVEALGAKRPFPSSHVGLFGETLKWVCAKGTPEAVLLAELLCNDDRTDVLWGEGAAFKVAAKKKSDQILKVLVSKAAETNRDLSLHDNVALKWAIEADDSKVLHQLLTNKSVSLINKRSIRLAKTIGQ
jgi:hypothetical protein